MSAHPKNPGSVKPQARRKARRLALQALYQWALTGQSPQDIYQQFQLGQDTAGADLDYFQELLTQVAAQAAQLDQSLGEYLDRIPQHLDPIEHCLLRMAAYELQHRLDVPYRVVLDEAVQLAKKFGASESHKYINGVLDKMVREYRVLELKAGL